MASKNLLIKLASVSGISFIAGAVFTDAVKEADEDKMREIITAQKDRIAGLQAKVEFMENNGPVMGQGGADAGGAKGAGKDSEAGGVRGGDERGVDAGGAKGVSCSDQLSSCLNKEIGRFTKDLWACEKMADTALYMKDMRSAVSCRTSREIHKVIEVGMERCEDAAKMTPNEDEKRIVGKHIRKMAVLRGDKKINPDGCVRGR